MGKMVYYYKLLLSTTNYHATRRLLREMPVHNMAKRFALDRLKKLNSKLPSFAFKDKRSQTKNKKCLSRPMPTRLSQSPFQFFFVARGFAAHRPLFEIDLWASLYAHMKLSCLSKT
jgi:hypothetical protein